MALKRVQIIGHTTAEANNFQGREREVTVDISVKELRVHDGITLGGHRILNKEQTDIIYLGRDDPKFIIDGSGLTVNAEQGILPVTLNAKNVLNAFHMDGTTGAITIAVSMIVAGVNVGTLAGGAAQKAQNLTDLASIPAARTNLGLGAAALLATPIAIASGGTGSTTAATARTALGLGAAALLADPIPIANGGTGQTSAAAAFTALKQAATTAATGVLEIATDAEYVAQTATDKAVVPSNFAAKPAFKAHKNGTDQVIAGATFTMITFPASVYDVGNHFSSNTWQPPAGRVRIHGSCLGVAGIISDALAIAAIYKNGVPFAYEYRHSSGNGQISCSVQTTDLATGSDVYQFYARIDGGANKTIDGALSSTWFTGEMI